MSASTKGTGNDGTIMGVGVDILERSRVAKIHDLPRVAEFVFSPTESEEFFAHPDPSLYFASRFALKEAVIKAYPGKLHFLDFEIAKNGDKPVVRFLAKHRTPCELRISLSHSLEYVAGFAVAVYYKNV